MKAAASWRWICPQGCAALWLGAERRAPGSAGGRFAEPEAVATRVCEVNPATPRQFFDTVSDVLIDFRYKFTMQRVNVLDQHKNGGVRRGIAMVFALMSMPHHKIRGEVSKVASEIQQLHKITSRQVISRRSNCNT